MLIENGVNNVKWARIELKRRYQETTHEEQMRIISYFKNGTTKQDVKWGETREKNYSVDSPILPGVLDL